MADDYDNDDISVWATDTAISLPQPPQEPILVDMGAFGFTEYGLNHNLTTSDIEDYLPSFLGDPYGQT